MAIDRWAPPVEATRQEQFLLKRLERNRKLFGFLRQHRHELFDDEFQIELASMYRDTGAGDPPRPPAQLAMALLLQSYSGASDAEAVELTVVDLRWQMVLGCLGSSEPAFAQGTLSEFRNRMIRTDMDRRLLERTRELAHRTQELRRTQAAAHVASGHRLGAARGRGSRRGHLQSPGPRRAQSHHSCVAIDSWLGQNPASPARRMSPVLLEPSIKAALDVQWSDPDQKAEALQIAGYRIESIQKPGSLARSRIESISRRYREAVRSFCVRLRAQDLRAPIRPRQCRTRIRKWARRPTVASPSRTPTCGTGARARQKVVLMDTSGTLPMIPTRR